MSTAAEELGEVPGVTLHAAPGRPMAVVAITGPSLPCGHWREGARHV